MTDCLGGKVVVLLVVVGVGVVLVVPVVVGGAGEGGVTWGCARGCC